MGYTTDFTGKFFVSPAMHGSLITFLKKFADTRRMGRRDLNEEVYGPEGAYFVGGGGEFGQAEDARVINNNRPPKGQPGLWCQWVPTDDGTAIEWDGGEKFYDYIEWLAYIMRHFLIPNGYILNGTVCWFGEERSDTGNIVVNNNVIRVSRMPHIDPEFLAINQISLERSGNGGWLRPTGQTEMGTMRKEVLAKIVGEHKDEEWG